jgi:hypothetical protein
LHKNVKYIHYVRLFQLNFFLSANKTPAVLIFSNFTTTCKDLIIAGSELATSLNRNVSELLFFFLPAKVNSLEALFNNLFKLSLKFKYYRALLTGTFSFLFAPATALHTLFNLSLDSRFFLFLIAKRVCATPLSCDTKVAIKDYSTFASNLKPKYSTNLMVNAPLQVFDLFITSLLQVRSILLLASLL